MLSIETEILLPWETKVTAMLPIINSDILTISVGVSETRHFFARGQARDYFFLYGVRRKTNPKFYDTYIYGFRRMHVHD